ncbi:MAG: DNA polymerase, partial [Cyanobacteria bacterium J06629_18]
PVIAHNMAGYDIHHICATINKCNPKNTFSVIPTTDEKYISFSFSVWVNSFVDKNEVVKNVYEEMRFLDSFKFMPQSLDKLASFLPKDKFIYLESQFHTHKTPTQINLLKRKGVYPYSYMDSFDKFSEDKLPPKEFWKNTLEGGEISITDSDLQHANLVFQEYDCKTLGDYHDLYLHTDVLILASIFEEFRKVCHATYGLDCAHFYTASNLSGEAFLKVCNADIELLTDREHLEIAENLIRGGISSVFAKRKFEANNKYLPTHNPSQQQTFGFFIDANNLYGGIMEKFPLPLKNFVLKKEGEFDLKEILNTANDSPIGYVLEVDLHYPDHLHDSHADFPLAPTKESINIFWLGEYQNKMLEMNGTRTFSTKNKKLIQTLYDKTNYTLHYLTLKLYCELGLEVTKVHRVLQFEQSKWLQPYIQLNTMKRKASSNKFEENFYRLMSNSGFETTMEWKRKTSDC